MRELVRALASGWAWLSMGLVILLFFPMVTGLAALSAPFDRARYAAGRWFRVMGVMMARVNPLWRFRWSGTPPADPRRPWIVVSNHESFADIPLISQLPWEMKWMGKAEMFRIPVVGWMMRAAGDIPIQRGVGGRAVLDAMARCREVLARQVSVMIFPEGTRSPTGEMLPFKDGAFRLAIETGTAILPLAVAGTRNALPKHDWRFNRARAEVRILQPVETAGLTMADLQSLKARVREAIARGREELRAGLDGERGTGNGER
ncbi:MAG TPA: lysophospholipid acyltransferase family protein [Gemmatimonadales bacterium]|nr:lysophospholipid acyltransferase family protein [Gemmatimonadales bacterium]